MKRALCCSAMVAGVVALCAASGQQPTFRAGSDAVRVFVTVTDRDGRLVTTLDARGLRGARRRQAAADHSVRQYPAAHPADRHAGRLGQHGRQPAAAARRRAPTLRAAAAGRSGARRLVRARGHDQPDVHARSRGARAPRSPTTIAPDAPTPLWRAIDEALDALRRRGRRAQGRARAERRQGQRPDRLSGASGQPG